MKKKKAVDVEDDLRKKYGDEIDKIIEDVRKMVENGENNAKLKKLLSEKLGLNDDDVYQFVVVG